MYFDLFINKQSVADEFATTLDESHNILYAWYEYENYSGDAWVIYERDNKLYEVHGGHCSCNGLEGQWKPEETSWQALKHRLDNGSIMYGFPKVREAYNYVVLLINGKA